MAIDPNIIFKQDKFSDAFKAGQDIAQTALKNPVELQQAQANLQSSLTQNEADKLKLAQQQKDMEFKSFLDTYKPTRSQDGQIDVGKTYDDMTRAGFGQYATAHLASNFQNDASQIKNAEEAVNVATKYAQQYSQAISSLPPEQQAQAIKRADDFAKAKLGRSMTDILGPDWAKSGQFVGVSPMDKESNYRANLAVGNTAEGRDPKSKLNTQWADFLAKNYPNLPKTTLFEAQNLPGYKDVLGSFQISAPERAAAAGEVTTQAAEISDLDSLTTRIRALESKGLWRPGMFIKNAIGKITNDADKAELQAVADALKTKGVDLDQMTSMSGLLKNLEQQKAKAELKQRQAKTVVGSATRPGTAQAAGTAPIKGTKYTFMSQGRQKFVTLTPEQEADPRFMAKLKAVQAKKVQ